MKRRHLVWESAALRLLPYSAAPRVRLGGNVPCVVGRWNVPGMCGEPATFAHGWASLCAPHAKVLPLVFSADDARFFDLDDASMGECVFAEGAS